MKGVAEAVAMDEIVVVDTEERGPEYESEAVTDDTDWPIPILIVLEVLRGTAEDWTEDTAAADAVAPCAIW